MDESAYSAIKLSVASIAVLSTASRTASLVMSMVCAAHAKIAFR